MAVPADGDAVPAPMVREEKDWNVLYVGTIDVTQPFLFSREVDGEPDGRELKSSPVKRGTTPRRPSPHKRPVSPAKRPPLGQRPGNDWRGRLQAVYKQTDMVKTVTTAQGAVMIVPMKRGRGRPPKNAPPPPQKILVIPPLLKVGKGRGLSSIVSEEQFALERPLHYLHYEPDHDTSKFDVVLEDGDEDGWVSTEVADEAQRRQVMTSVEYDMDEQDFAWLRLFNEERQAAGLVKLEEDDFEFCMDRLEKHWFNLTKAYQKWQSRVEDQSLAEDFECEICGDGETTSSNLIVMCDGCDLAVHQDCYGVPHIPEGPWLCRRCYVGGGEGQAQCCLCPWPDGALKQTTDSKRPWAHLLCARFLGRETAVLNAAFQEPIDISGVHAGRAALTCIYCRRKGGAPIQCASKTCHLAFHPICARKAGAHLDLERAQGFCWKHSAASIPGPVPAIEVERVSRGGRGGGGRCRNRPVWLMEPIAPRIVLDRLIASPDLLLEEAGRTETVATVARYWALRRSAKRGLPLLRRLQLEPWSSLTPVNLADPASVSDGFATRRYLLNDLHRLSRVTEALLERERVALRSFSALSDAFQLATEPLQTLLRLLLRRAMAADPDSFFAQPVSPDEVPDYLDIIQHPMDFTTMATRLESFQYETLQDFSADLELIAVNAMTYNGQETVYYRAAETLREAMAPLLAKAKQALQAMGVTRNGQMSRSLLSLLHTRAEQPKATIKAKTIPVKAMKKPVSVSVSVKFKNGQSVWAPHPVHGYWPARTMSPSRLTKAQSSSLPAAVTRALKNFDAQHQTLCFFQDEPMWRIVEAGDLMPLTESFRNDVQALEAHTDIDFKASQAMKAAHRTHCS